MSETTKEIWLQYVERVRERGESVSKTPKKVWLQYVERMRKLCDKAGDVMAEFLKKHPVETEADERAVISLAQALSAKYGEGSAAIAADYYDTLADAQKAAVAAAIPAEPADKVTVEKMVKATIAHPAETVNGVKRIVKQAGADTMLKNASRDGAQFAWIPHGDTCPFCLMLASNGWQTQSKNAMKNGHAEHIHANCDCNYAVRFNSKTTYEGYDPESYYQQYRDANGDLNALRREYYAENKEKISAQKRAAYLARKQAESE